MSFATRTHRHHAIRSSAADRRHVQLDMPRLALDPLRSIVHAVLVVCAATSFISPFGWWGTAGAFLVLLLMTGFVLDVAFSLLADDRTGGDKR